MSQHSAEHTTNDDVIWSTLMNNHANCLDFFVGDQWTIDSVKAQKNYQIMTNVITEMSAQKLPENDKCYNQDGNHDSGGC